MAESKDTSSFFRKVVKFVANPTTEWADVAPSEEARETEFAKSELKAMIERKRRNDFVRKREFDMLRKVRREGLSGEQLAALGGSSKIDDSEGKLLVAESGAKQEAGVKAKIDEIEQQMVGDGFAPPPRRGPEFYNAPTQPAPMDGAARASARMPLSTPRPVEASVPANAAVAVAAPAAAPASAALSPLTLDSNAGDFGQAFAVEVSEVAHDPDLDEAVIAFANADFEQCEQALSGLTGQGGSRNAHAETWLVLFDLYRAIGQQHKFESLALDYAQQFGWSAPQWFSMPRMVAEAASEERPARGGSARLDGQVGWVCPDYVDADAVAKLSSQSLQMPLPWVFDWSALKGIEPEACARLSELFRSWIRQKLDMRWLGGEKLFAVLQDAAPTGVKDADPAYWQLRLDALRMTNRPDQFDECAIDYCVTYEVSPPSWEPAQCEVRISGTQTSTQSPPLSVVSEVSTSFLESRMPDESAGQVQVASVELSGQLVGDIGETLKHLEGQLGASTIVNVSCAKLIRVDFIAAGDLLNWVLARRGENRTVSFVEAHRLVALFFGAMGINEHARVKVRAV
ncbi:MAG: STAS domain-containing protein [Piscinibacter sp.]|nr:STAS domain-containing protein [Piscinibacter sp.]